MRNLLCLLTLLAVGLSLNAADPNCPTVDDINRNYRAGSLDSLLEYVVRLDSCTRNSQLRAYGLHQLGRLHNDLGQYEASVPVLRRAMYLREQALGESDPETAKTLYNLGVAYRNLGNYRLALQYLERAETIFREESSGKTAILLTGKEIAEVLVALGEFAGADERLQHIIDLAMSEGQPVREANYRLDRGNLLHSLHRLEPAKEELLRAEELYLAHRSAPRFVADNLNSCYLNLALVFSGLDDPTRSIEYDRKAIRGYRNSGNQTGEAKCRANLSLTYIRLGQYSSAEWELNRAGQLSQSVPVSEQAALQAQIADNRGDLLLARGDVQGAVEAYQRAVARLVPGWEPDSLPAVPPYELLEQTILPEHLLNHLGDKTRGLEKLFAETNDTTLLEATLVHYRSLSDLIDIMRYRHRVQASKLFWREEVSPVYEAAVALCHRLGDAEQAYFFMERSKAMLLLDALRENRIRLSFNSGESARELSLRRNLELLRLQLLEAEESERAEKMAEVLNAQKQYDAFRDTLELRYPELARIRRNRKHLQPEELRAQLPGDDWLFIEYMVGREHLYCWSMGPSGDFRLRSVPVGDMHAQLDRFMTQADLRGEESFIDAEAFARAAYDLYITILEPETSAHPTARELLIVPDGPLAYVPFDALLDKPKYDPNNYLLYDYLIRFAYSGEVLVRQQAQEAGRREVLYMAPAFPNGERGLSPLVEGLDLSERIGCCMTEFLTDEATTAHFLLEAGKASVINLYTHARLGDDGIPRVEFIDTSLLLPEIYALQIPADLVILAACETGIGDYREGEGVMSLSRGFTHAGASSLVATLWTVRSGFTADVLDDLFSDLEDGRTKAEALWAAKKAYLIEAGVQKRQPYFWAGMVYYGADGTVELPRPCFWWRWYALGGVGLLLIGLLLRRREDNGQSKTSNEDGELVN